jgi:hypothetical protein
MREESIQAEMVTAEATNDEAIKKIMRPGIFVYSLLS